MLMLVNASFSIITNSSLRVNCYIQLEYKIIIPQISSTRQSNFYKYWIFLAQLLSLYKLKSCFHSFMMHSPCCICDCICVSVKNQTPRKLLGVFHTCTSLHLLRTIQNVLSVVGKQYEILMELVPVSAQPITAITGSRFLQGHYVHDNMEEDLSHLTMECLKQHSKQCY